MQFPSRKSPASRGRCLDRFKPFDQGGQFCREQNHPAIIFYKARFSSRNNAPPPRAHHAFLFFYQTFQHGSFQITECSFALLFP
jgi:hypothetical protein